MSDRAVSDVISFVLIFSLITTTVAVVSVVGFAGLEDVRDAERVNNAERGFEVLASNIDDIAQEDAPSRGTEIRLSEATLRTGEPSRVTVEIDGSSYPGGGPLETEPIVYDSGTSAIVYEAGAVFRVENGNAVMIRQPSQVITQQRMVLQIPGLDAVDESSTKGGSSVVLVRTLKTESALYEYRSGTSSSVKITIETTPARAEAWERYLEQEISWVTNTCSISGGDTVICGTFTVTDTTSFASSTIQIKLSD